MLTSKFLLNVDPAAQSSARRAHICDHRGRRCKERFWRSESDRGLINNKGSGATPVVSRDLADLAGHG